MPVPDAGEALPAIRVRTARFADALALLRWRNDPVARAKSGSSNPIGLVEHLRWFRRSKFNADTIILIIVAGSGARVGTVRFVASEPDLWTTSISIAKEARGRSYGIGGLLAGEAYVQSQHRQPVFRARVSMDNIASQKLFERAGYSQIGKDDQGFMLFIKLPAAGGQQ